LLLLRGRQLVAEVAGSRALGEQARQRHQAVARRDGAECLGLEAVHELGAEPRILGRQVRVRAGGLPLRRSARLALRALLAPVTRHPEQIVLPVLDPAERARVGGVDVEHAREAGAPEPSPASRRRRCLAKDAIGPHPPALEHPRPDETSNPPPQAGAPAGLGRDGFDEAEERLLEVLAHHGRDDSAPGHALLALVSQAARARDVDVGAAQRRGDGVVHTPIEVARAMVREADALLVRHDLPSIGSRALSIVDPATGPGIFLAAVMAHAPGEGGRLLGVDVDPRASVRTADLLSRFATHRGHALALEVRDALGAALELPPPLPDGARAGRGPESVLVIGNPPWSARGLGPAYVEALVRDFHVDRPGAPLRERRPGVPADAYVRFLRWAIEAVERAPGGGALALVTNASYLDGPVHRGLRAMLRARFDEVSVIDLGGSALVARSPGVVDGNVFGVRPGAAILLAARRPGPRAPANATVSYRGVTGSVADKLAALAAPLGAPVPVREPLASLRPRTPAAASYTSWPSLAEWLPFHAEGVQTNRDEHVIDRDRDVLRSRIEAMSRGHGLPASRPHFDPRAAQRELARLVADGAIERHVARLAFRPFDERFAFLHPALCHRPRPALLRAMAKSPLALVSVRKDRGTLPWAHVALVSAPIDNCYLSARSSCRARAFPSHRADGTPNVAPSITAVLAERGIVAPAEELLAFLAAVLASPAYAERHAEALALDYPRVPVPRDENELKSLASLGRRLAAALSAHTEPIRVRAGHAVVRVGHHAFDPDDSALRPLLELRAELDDAVQPLLSGHEGAASEP